MHLASNYHKWIFALFKPFLGKRLVEVGAGIGSFSELILSEQNCEILSLIEPSINLFPKLVGSVRALKTSARIDTYNGTFQAVAALIAAKSAPDSIIYVNVLEHVKNDDAEIQLVHQTLALQGRVCLFVPALPKLFGAFDEYVGHVRRYGKRELVEKLRRAGFKIAVSTYFDLPGIVPWWVKYCLLRSAHMDRRSVQIYDRLIVPAVRRIESLIPPPLGKNLVVVGEKR